MSAQRIAPPSTLEMLSRVPLFSSLDADHLRTILRTGKEREYAPGGEIVRTGDRGIGFYLLLHGGVEVRREGTVLARLGPGEFFGEMALFDDQPRSADVVAVRPTRCLVLSPWEFWSAVGKDPVVLRALLRETVRRLRGPHAVLSE